MKSIYANKGRGSWPRTAALPVLVAGLMIIMAGVAGSGEPKAPLSTADPMIKITSPPMKVNLDDLLAKVAKDVAREAGVDINFITYYWQTFDAIHCPGCDKAGVKKPIFVELYVPGFMTTAEYQKVMTALAEALARYTDYTKKDLFMHTHAAQKEQLFIMGGLVTNWKQVGGPDDAAGKKK